jgi:hypothetical protein
MRIVLHIEVSRHFGNEDIGGLIVIDPLLDAVKDVFGRIPIDIGKTIGVRVNEEIGMGVLVDVLGEDGGGRMVGIGEDIVV